ncbi:hypothetical protein Tco_1328223 [Tanacetum coccineum]
MSSSNQQTLAESGATDRPPILKKWNYIPWESRFRRFLENKGEDGERMWYLITKGPYVRPMITDLDDPHTRAIIQKFFTPTNNHLRTSSSTRNQVVIHDGRVDSQTKNAGYGGNGNKNTGRQNRNQTVNAGNGQRFLSSEVNLASPNRSYSVLISKGVHEHTNHEKLKTVINTSDDDQIDSNIIFDDPYHSKELKQELKQELNEEVQEMLNIFDSIEKKVETQSQKDNMFQNEIDRLLEASFTKSEIVYSMVKRALFTSLVAAKSKNLGATYVVTKSRFSVAKTPTAKNKVIQLVLWIIDIGCSKHMTGILQLLRNFVEKFIGTVCFRNNHFIAITGYGDYVQGNLTICHADISIFIGYSESSRGFRIYNRRTKKIMETIHVKFDELTAMASECNNSGPGFNCSNFQDSLEDSQSVQSKEGLDNLFGLLYKEYYATSTPKVSGDFAINTVDNEDTPSYSLIIVEKNEAPQIVTSSEEAIANEATTPVSNENANEPI